MNIGRKIYYDLETGNVILNTGERSGDVVESTIDQDFASYQILNERVRETVGVITLAYGEYKESFQSASGYRIENGGLQFSYDTSPTGEPVYSPPLEERVKAVEDTITVLLGL